MHMGKGSGIMVRSSTNLIIVGTYKTYIAYTWRLFPMQLEALLLLGLQLVERTQARLYICIPITISLSRACCCNLTPASICIFPSLNVITGMLHAKNLQINNRGAFLQKCYYIVNTFAIFVTCLYAFAISIQCIYSSFSYFLSFPCSHSIVTIFTNYPQLEKNTTIT